MGNISRTAVHEAGHVIANIALGLRFFAVHVEPIWYQDETTGLVHMTRKPDAAGHVEGVSRTPQDEDVVCVSGYMAEKIWIEHNSDKRFKYTIKDPPYATDLAKIINLRRARRESRKILTGNYPYLDRVARLLDANRNHTFKESEILPVCDIWEENPISKFMKGTDTEPLSYGRYTYKFKWVPDRRKYSSDKLLNCPLSCE